MLSIGITVCDNDYSNLDFLLKQIEEKVKVEHEVIIIDNREKFKDVKTDWTPTYQFGYNAYQFSARAEIIERSKGQYIWFIDGDDEIGEIKEFDYTEDIIVFSYNTYPSGNFLYDNCIKTENLEQLLFEICLVLWNKFIKKDLFSKEFIDTYRTKKIVHNEDAIWLYEALKHAKSIREEKNIIYFHKEGLSNKVGKITLEDLKALTTGFEDSRKIILENFDPTVSKKLLDDTYAYIGSYISKTKEIEQATEYIMNIIPKNEFQDVLQENVYTRCQSQKQLETIINTVKKRYGEEFPFKKKVCKVTYSDGRVEDYEFVATVDFEEVKETYADGEWNHNLSIICLVYDGNKQYLAGCTSKIKENVNVRHEVIIVDNREDKSDDLNYVGEAKIVKAEGNVGILEGRRLGFEASSNDYIWFIDIDDSILYVENMNYGNNDILTFPYYYEGIHNCEFKRVVSENDFFTPNFMWTINILLWNKWFKRSVLERAYKDIPHFYCIYNEDNIVTYTALKYSKYVEMFDGEPIYAHVANDSSTTMKTINNEKSVDTLFIGHDEAVEYFRTHFNLCRELSADSPYNTVFYLDIMEKSDECILEYFAKKMISIFGLDNIQEALSLFKKEKDYKRIKKYFN